MPFIQVALLMPVWADGTLALIVSLCLVNLLVLLEVADRLSLKGELEVAREIQLRHAPAGDLQRRRRRDLRHDPSRQYGRRRFLRRAAAPRRPDHRDARRCRGKGSPAALLMALLLAVLRTLVDEELEAARRSSSG